MRTNLCHSTVLVIKKVVNLKMVKSPHQQALKKPIKNLLPMAGLH